MFESFCRQIGLTKESKRLSKILLSLNIIVLFSLAFPQELDPVLETGIRCSINIPEDNTTNSDCIDVSQSGQVNVEYTVASNVTRIEKDGLRICGPADPSEKRPLTVIFMVDHSGSMYEIGDDHQIDPNDFSTQPQGAMDFNFTTPKAVTQAMKTIADRIPGSVIGYGGFSGGLCDGTASEAPDQKDGAGERVANWNSTSANTIVNPLSADNPANMTTLFSKTDYNASNFYFSCGSQEGGGTYYFAPFQKAQEMILAARANHPDNNEIIIFVTDGNPSESSQADYADLNSFNAMADSVINGSNTNFPKVFSIFLGGTNDKLQQLSEQSGGAFVSVNEPADISDALQGFIIEDIYSFAWETSVSYTNSANENIQETPTLDTTGSGASGKGEAKLILNNPIPLNLGSNLITINTVNTKRAGVNYSAVVNVNVSEAPRTTAETFPVTSPNPFSDACEEAAKITFTLPGGTENITELNVDQSDFNIQLARGPVGLGEINLTTISNDEPGPNVPLTASGELFSGTDKLALGNKLYTYRHPIDKRDQASSLISKRTGPQIDSILKLPSNFKQYQESESGEIKNFPDTLIVSITEPLETANPVDLNLWNELILYSASSTCETDGYTEGDENFKIQEVLAVEQLEGGNFKVLIDGSRGSGKIMTGNCGVINPKANVSNLSTTPSPIPVIGHNSQTSLIESGIVTPVIGLTEEVVAGENTSNLKIPVIDNTGNVVGEVTQPNVEFWIPPIGLTSEGEIDEQAQLSCTETSNQTVQPIPFNCMSKVRVYSQVGYTAKVDIFDNLGKVVHTSTQRFGLETCKADIENPDRIQPAGYLSYLVWNQRDLDGQFVASGVYIWRVAFTFVDGSVQQSNYRQGVVRDSEPQVGCHLN